MRIMSPYLILNIRKNDCEIESSENKKREVVHANNLVRFVVDAVADLLTEDSEGMISSEESTIELANEQVGVCL